MSRDNEELIDYEDEDVLANGGAISGITGSASGNVLDGDDKDKKNFSGIHSTGFRSVCWFKAKSLSSHCFFKQRFPVEARVIAGHQ